MRVLRSCAGALVIPLCAGIAGCGGSRHDAAHVTTPRKPIEIGVDCLTKSGVYESTKCRRQFDARLLLGQSLASAEKQAQALGLEIRVVETEGRKLSVTGDQVFNRVDIGMRSGRVTRIVGQG
jgi:hypothetical protein